MLLGEWNLKDALVIAREEAKEEALKEGIEIGKIEGIEIGEVRGIGIGREEGIGIGREEGIGIGDAKLQKFLTLLENGTSLDEAKRQLNLQ